ncbi:acyl-coenzyme A thioesterase THEM4-like [Erythrolamprus reginae]|uniref:acyl-coenzyme A thioesterase THEM4-like n=1 Tax=Erythrolamprus reginae TaxID=121349 RepID=UPI00396CAC71
MHRVLRSINQRAKGLTTRMETTTKELLVHPPRVVSRRTSTQQPHQPHKNVGFPNPSWSREMLDQFEKFAKRSKDGSWEHLPSYENLAESGPEGHQREESQNRKSCMFLRSIPEEGLGFEFTMFLNRSERRVVAIFQMGPYLEGRPGLAHGGVIATLLDHTMGASMILANPRVMTVNLNINCKSPVALGSVVLVETRVDRIEGRKVFLSGEIRSADGQTLHANATCKYEVTSVKFPQPGSLPFQTTSPGNSTL